MDEDELWQAYRNGPTGQERGKLREPAKAIAVAKCICFRLGFKTQQKGRWFHTEECTYCKYSMDVLGPLYEEWVQWSGLNDPEEKHATLVMFESLPAEIQAQEVRKAQGYVRKIHQAPDRVDGAESGATPDVSPPGGSEVSPSSRQDARMAPPTRSTGRTSSGVRRGQSSGTANGTTSHSGEW